jgi:hypothetical protein
MTLKGGERMKKKLFMIFSLAFLIILSASATVLAIPPVSAATTFSQTLVSVVIDPGTKTTAGTETTIKDAVSLAYYYGTPWGNSLTANAIGTTKIDTTTYTGSTVSFPTAVYASGNLQGILKSRINGIGTWTYMGPTFTFMIGTRTGTLTNGATYMGVLFQGNAVRVGTSGKLTGLVESDQGTGLSIVTGPLAGVTVSYWTGWVVGGHFDKLGNMGSC